MQRDLVERNVAASSSAERVRALESERQSLISLLGILRGGEPATRLDLEREARLGRAVVMNRLATLSGFGLIDENGVGRSIGGRAPRLVRFRAEAARILAASLDGSTIGVALADLSGRLILEHYEEFDLASPTETLFERLEALFRWSLSQDGAPLWGLSLGVPGAVEFGGKPGLTIPGFAAFPTWTEARLAERLVSRFRAPLWARNAVQTETLGEAAALTPAQCRDMLFVNLGTEITVGVFSAGGLLPGAQGIGGQIGHVWVGEGDGLICGCGNVGCLQTVAGCEAVAREGCRAAEDGRSRLLAEMLGRAGVVTVADIGTAARLGDPFSADLLGRCGRTIGLALAGAVNLLNPATVLIGGELAQTGDICLAGIREGVYRHAHPLATRDLSIVRSRMGRSSGLVGAANLAVDELFAPDFLDGWITFGSPLSHPQLGSFLALADAAVGH